MPRKLKAREKRQRQITGKFLKTFLPLCLIAYFLQSLPFLVNTSAQFLENKLLPLLPAPIYNKYFSSQRPLLFALNECNDLSTTNKTFLITGGNSGLGFETAKQLAKAGAKTVILGCRDTIKCLEARLLIDIARKTECNNDGPSNVVVLESSPLDLDDINAINTFGKTIKSYLKTHASGNLDVLINNAGIMGSTTLTFNQHTGGEKQLHTNHLSHYVLTNLLLEELRAGGGGRVVNHSSLMGFMPFFWNSKDFNFQSRFFHSLIAYGQSKRANLHFTHKLHSAWFEKYNISVVAAHPGYSRTNLMTNNWQFAPAALRLFVSTNKLMSMSSEVGAASQIRAAVDETVASDSFVGPLLATLGPAVVLGKSYKNIFNYFWPVGFSETEGDRLMDYSAQRTGITFS